MVIGLTGNSGSGKSSVAGLMAAEHGAYIIDADKTAHGVLLKDGAAYAEVVDCFGEGILNAGGEIDRRRLGQIVFGDEAARARLMYITHKHIKAEMLAELAAKRELYPHIVMDAPLLIESGLHKHADTVWLVHAEHDLRLRRVMARDGLSEAEALARFSSQSTFGELEKHADAIIDNSLGMEELRAALRPILGIIPSCNQCNTYLPIF